LLQVTPLARISAASPLSADTGAVPGLAVEAAAGAVVASDEAAEFEDSPAAQAAKASNKAGTTETLAKRNRGEEIRGISIATSLKA
jgi:hypothetical protein